VSFGFNEDKNLVKKRVIATRDKIAGILKLYGLNPNKAKRAKTTFNGGKTNKRKQMKQRKTSKKRKNRKNRSRR
jgi:hypothetical protein